MLRSSVTRRPVASLRRLLSTHASNFNDAPNGPILPSESSLSFLVFLTGTCAGGVGALVGMGGAFIALPVLTGFFGLRQHIAHGTSMAAVVATSMGGCLAYLQRDGDMVEKFKSLDWNHFPTQIGNVHLLIGTAVAASSSITVFAGARIAQAMTAVTLKKYLGIFMLLIAPTVPLREHLKAFSGPSEKSGIEKQSEISLDNLEDVLNKVIKPACVGACSGVLAGVFGVGGGAITVPALCTFTDLDLQVALGTSLFAMMPTAISGCIAHIRHGNMRARYGVPLAAGCFVGSYVGGSLGKNVEDAKLKYGFAGIMSVLGARTLMQALRAAK